MFEVIWSVFNDAYIIRGVNCKSSITPNFIGTYDDCVIWVSQNK